MRFSSSSLSGVAPVLSGSIQQHVPQRHTPHATNSIGFFFKGNTSTTPAKLHCRQLHLHLQARQLFSDGLAVLLNGVSGGVHQQQTGSTPKWRLRRGALTCTYAQLRQRRKQFHNYGNYPPLM